MEIKPRVQRYYRHETSPGFEPGTLDSNRRSNLPVGPIAIPINVLEFRDDGDDRGDGGSCCGRRSIVLSLSPSAILVFRPKSKVLLLQIGGGENRSGDRALALRDMCVCFTSMDCETIVRSIFYLPK